MSYWSALPTTSSCLGSTPLLLCRVGMLERLPPRLMTTLFDDDGDDDEWLEDALPLPGDLGSVGDGLLLAILHKTLKIKHYKQKFKQE